MNTSFLPIADRDWPEAIADMRTDFAGALNVYRVMAHNPSLLRAWATLRQHLVIDSALSDKQKELVILRTGHCWGSRYEWAHHVVRGLNVGLCDARIASAAMAVSEVGHEDDEDIVLIRATDALLDEGRLSAPLQIHLEQFLSKAAIIDLMATIGMYTTLAFLANSFEIPIDADVLHSIDRNRPGAWPLADADSSTRRTRPGPPLNSRPRTHDAHGSTRSCR